jgi:hypothetical protein
MSRTAHLEALYLKMVYTIIEEQKRSDCSEAVITACEVAKRVIHREHAAIMQSRQQSSTQVLQ